jgi:hypothetical protein
LIPSLFHQFFWLIVSEIFLFIDLIANHIRFTRNPNTIFTRV